MRPRGHTLLSQRPSCTHELREQCFAKLAEQPERYEEMATSSWSARAVPGRAKASYRDTTLIMQLLRDNKMLRTSAAEGDR